MTVHSALATDWKATLKPALQKEMHVKSPMQVPEVTKVVVNVGIGSYLQKLGTKDYSFVVENLRAITGQQPVVRTARKSVSNFKLRQGMPVGVYVTLRGERAYAFLEKMVHVVFPRVRDFRGIGRKSFDKAGNYSVAFTDHTVFPEGVLPEDARRTFGLQVTVCTTAKTPAEGEMLLEKLGFPFKKKPTV
ncbi:50S ribosomal protein L5 [Candidatus Peribacteria bacterium]|nr:50S ribosomal protein L5 [Candidatus Peribacteria bacterium]